MSKALGPLARKGVKTKTAVVQTSEGGRMGGANGSGAISQHSFVSRVGGSGSILEKDALRGRG